MTKRVEALLRKIMENGLAFDVRTDTNDNGGGKVREYRCPARHRIVPYTSIRKSLSSAGHRAGLGHVRPHDSRPLPGGRPTFPPLFEYPIYSFPLYSQA